MFYIFHNHPKRGWTPLYRPGAATLYTFSTKGEAIALIQTFPGFQKNPSNYLITTNKNYEGE